MQVKPELYAGFLHFACFCDKMEKKEMTTWN